MEELHENSMFDSGVFNYDSDNISELGTDDYSDLDDGNYFSDDSGYFTDD